MELGVARRCSVLLGVAPEEDLVSCTALFPADDDCRIDVRNGWMKWFAEQCAPYLAWARKLFCADGESEWNGRGALGYAVLRS
jgi:hypothetical protein